MFMHNWDLNALNIAKNKENTKNYNENILKKVENGKIKEEEL